MCSLFYLQLWYILLGQTQQALDRAKSKKALYFTGFTSVVVLCIVTLVSEDKKISQARNLPEKLTVQIRSLVEVVTGRIRRFFDTG